MGNDPTIPRTTAEAAGSLAEAVREERAGQIDDAIFKYSKIVDEWQKAHIESENQHRAEVMRTIGTLATKEELKPLATTADIQEVLKLMKGLNTTFMVLSYTGKWGKTIIVTLAVLIGSIAVITGGIKTFLAAIVGWSVSK